MEMDIKQILEALMSEQDNTRVDAFFTHIKAFINEARTNPTYREFLMDAEEVLQDIASSPEILEDPATRLALKGMFQSALNLLRGKQTIHVIFNVLIFNRNEE